MTKLHAHPYDISARGLYFDSAEEYDAKAAKNRNSFGGIVEEYEIQFIDGDALDAELFQALAVNQANFPAFFDACDAWDQDDKIKVIIAVGEAATGSILLPTAPIRSMSSYTNVTTCATWPCSSSTMACSVKSLLQSRTISIMRPSPVIWLPITGRPKLQAIDISIGMDRAGGKWQASQLVSPTFSGKTLGLISRKM